MKGDLKRYVRSMEMLDCILVSTDDNEITFQIPDDNFWNEKRINEAKTNFEKIFKLKMVVIRLF